MKGTEKQIAWATEIRENVIRTLNQIMDMLPTQAPNETALKMAQSEVQSRINRLNAESIHAGDIIDLFKDIRFRGDVEENIRNIMAVYNVAYPNTNGQHMILGR